MPAGLAALCGFAALGARRHAGRCGPADADRGRRGCRRAPRFRRFRRAGGAAEADQFRFRCVRPGARLAACSHSAEARPAWPLAALFGVALATLSAYAAFLVLASRDLMIADFMTYRGIAIMVARLIDARNWPLLLGAAVSRSPRTIPWAPALVPGLVLAVTNPTSRAIYTFALIALYVAPAALALSILARDLARRAGLAGGARPAIVLALGAAAAFLAFPAAFAVAARGMPDVGGLVLAVCALRLAEQLARLLALRKGLDALIRPMIRRVAVALALTLYAMFAFRRWYGFAAAGIVVMLALEVAAIAFRRRARFRLPDAVAAAALGALTLLALMSPVVVGWAPNLGAHDYAQTYAGLSQALGCVPARAWGLGRAHPRACRVGRHGLALGALPRGGRLLRLILGGARSPRHCSCAFRPPISIISI